MRLPTDLVWRYRRKDCREGGRHPIEVFDALRQSIRAEGIRECLRIFVDWDRQHAVVGNGNHRIAIAVLEGLPDVPVLVVPYTLPERYPWSHPISAADAAAFRRTLEVEPTAGPRAAVPGPLQGE